MDLVSFIQLEFPTVDYFYQQIRVRQDLPFKTITKLSPRPKTNPLHMFNIKVTKS